MSRLIHKYGKFGIYKAKDDTVYAYHYDLSEILYSAKTVSELYEKMKGETYSAPEIKFVERKVDTNHYANGKLWVTGD